MHWGSFVESVTKELTEAGEAASVGLITFFCSPAPLLTEIPGREIVKHLQTLPLVDLYNGIIHTLSLLHIQSDEINVEWAPLNMESYVAQIASKVNDRILSRIVSLRSTNAILGNEDPATKRILELYESGRYSECIDEYQKSIQSLKDPLAFSNILAKAAAYSGDLDWHLGHGILFDLISDLADIYRLNDRSVASRDRIISRIIQLHGILPTTTLQIPLIVALPLAHSKKAITQLLKLSEIESKEPMRLLNISPQREVIEHLVRRDVFNTNTADLQRKIRRALLNSIDNSDSTDVFAQFALLRATDILRKDFYELLTYYCLKFEHIEKLLEDIATALVQTPDIIICLPMGEIIESIETHRISSEDAIIICNSYNRRISTTKDYVLHEALEDYLDAKKISRPSELLSQKSKLTPKEVTFFLEVCTLEVMDFLSCFDDSDDLRAERMKILDKLLVLDAINPDERMKELELLVSQTIIDSVTHKINGPKIYIDNEIISKKARPEVETLLRTYREADEKDDGTQRFTLLAPEFRGEDGPQLAYVSGARANAVLKMRSVVCNIFRFDEKHGLDKNLSTEIRHGFFANQMRASLEKYQLITQANDAGQYEPNLHWRKENDFLIISAVERIDNVLKKFSERFDALIGNAEGWMKIGDSPGEGPYMEMDTEELESLKLSASGGGTAEELINQILDVIWERTEKWLEEMRDRLNIALKNEIDCLFDELEANISGIGHGAPLIKLTSAIREARREIAVDIVTTAEWFRRSSTIDIGSSNIEYVVRAATSSFEKVKSLEGSITMEVESSAGATTVSGKAVRPFVIAVINLLDNCFIHSGNWRDTIVMVHVYKDSTNCMIEISNNLTSQKQALLTEKFIHELNEKARNQSSLVLMRAEGGSGVSKAYQQIFASRIGSNLEVKLHENRFIARISYPEIPLIH